MNSLFLLIFLLKAELIFHLKVFLCVGVFVLFLHSVFCLFSSCNNILTKLKGIETFSISRCGPAILPFAWLKNRVILTLCPHFSCAVNLTLSCSHQPVSKSRACFLELELCGSLKTISHANAQFTASI